MRASLERSKQHKRTHKGQNQILRDTKLLDPESIAEKTMNIPIWEFTASAIQKVLGQDSARCWGRKYLAWGDYHWRLYFGPTRNMYQPHVDYVTNFFAGRYGRLLDAGCGAGLILRRLNVETALKCHGFDISPLAIALAHAHGVRNCMVADFETFMGRRFDYLFIGDVLEHTRDPLHCLEIANTWLVKNGLILVSFPMQKGLNSGDYFHFWPEDAKRLVSQVFEIVNLDVQKRWLKIYISARKRSLCYF